MPGRSPLGPAGLTRRGLVAGGLAGLALAGGLAGAGFSLRWHATPRRRPYLTEDHLQGLLALPAAQRRVLFVGNSFTLRHDVPGQVARRATVPLQIAVAAANGARLVETWRIGAFRAVLRAGWDVLVLQDFSTTVLRAPDRWGAAYAMRAMAAEAGQGTAVLLYPNWAPPQGHPVYRGGRLAARSASRDAFAARLTAFYGGMAAREGWVRAPVTEALHGDIRLYSDPDGHHLSPAGAARVADVLWQELRGLLDD